MKLRNGIINGLYGVANRLCITADALTPKADGDELWRARVRAAQDAQHGRNQEPDFCNGCCDGECGCGCDD